MISRRDFGLGLVTIIIWAANTVVTKYITMEVTPFIGLAIRMVIASFIFLPLIRWPGKEKFWVIVQITFLMVVMHWSSLIWSIDKLEASMAALLLQTQIIFSALLGRFLFKETFGWRTGAGIAIGIAGVAVLVGLPQNPPSPIGVIVLVFSMLSIALSYTRMKALSGVSPINYIAHLHILGVLPCLLMAFAFEKPLEVNWGELNYGILGFCIMFQVLMVSLSHMLWQRLMARNAMTALPNMALLLPIFGVVFAVIFLGEQLTPSMIIGGLITMSGVGIVMIRRQKRLQA